MILIADGGSTKVDWIAVDASNKEVFRVRTLGLNPAVVAPEELHSRIAHTFQLMQVKETITAVYFYGAGCGTPKPSKILQETLQTIFTTAAIYVAEDLLAAVYASTGVDPAIVCILGTGSNSCYFDGKKMHTNTVSLGYTLMDEASGNYFGKQLLRDYYYQKMPKALATQFNKEFELDPDVVKFNLYRQPNPNTYLATFATFLFTHKETTYIQELIQKGFAEFFEYRVLPFQKTGETPLYFIGSIAYYFSVFLEKEAANHGLKIRGVIQRPIDALVDFHIRGMVKG